MRILITSTRMPFAIDAVRKLGATGHRVFASDTFRTAPGNHSKYVEEAFVTPSPTFATEAFVRAIEAIVVANAIDLVIPAFEEGLYLAAHRDRFDDKTDLFAPPVETLLSLHDKERFTALCASLGLLVPKTQVVKSREALREVAGQLDRYFAKAAYSRGGEMLLTNVGPLAGAVAIDDCAPTGENPWLVQEFLEGTDECSFSVAHEGRIAAHSAYVHPREIDHAGGIVFESVDPEPTFEIAERIVAATRYTGHISFDFIRTERGLVIIECNPRPTHGIVVMDTRCYEEALRDRHPVAPRLAPAGVTRKLSMALVRDMFLNWREIPKDLEHLLSPAEDVYAAPGDWLPALFQVLSYSQVVRYQLTTKRRDRSKLMAAYFHDIRYDGDRPLRVA
jgi:glutathione synthase/RimK-type ligase-like ATP-grasp enzyme